MDFDLEAGGRITGQVTQLVGGDPVPLVNIRVEAVDFETGEFGSGGSTDSGGYYSIEALAQGRNYRLQVQPWNSPDPQFFNFVAEYYDDQIFWEFATPVFVPIQAGVPEVGGINFEIAKGGAISGIVEANGERLQNVHVSADMFSGAPYGNSANTDHNGFYIIRGLPEDTYRVHANAWPKPFVNEFYDDTTDWSLATAVSVAEVIEGEDLPVTGNINFDLGPAFTISGTVTDGTVGIPNINVTASGIDVNSWEQAWTDANGNYTIYSLAPGNYEVATETSGTDYIRQQQQVDLTEGDATGINFELEIGANITGRVYVDGDSSGTYDSGEERVGVWITVSDWATGQFFSSGETDSEGRYEVRGLGAGSYAVSLDHGDHNLVHMVYPNDFGNGGAFPVDVTGSGDVNGIDFLAIQGFEIHGLVFFDANGDGSQQLPGEAGLRNIGINAEFQGGFWVHHVWAHSDSRHLCSSRCLPRLPHG